MNERIATRRAGNAADIALGHAAALLRQQNLPAAEKIFRDILKQDPNHFLALRNLAGVLVNSARHEEAVAFARRALNQRPDAHFVHVLLAEALRNLDRHQEAVDRARRAIALDPGLAEAHLVLARGLVDLGRYDEALRALSRAIELAPDQPHYYHYWGEITRWTADDPRLAALEALAQKSGSLSPDAQVYLNFALAKAYSDCGDIERSFRRQMEGSALWRKKLKYGEAVTLRQMEELRRAIDADWLNKHQGAGDPSSRPVFIVGMPRSGTTLVEQILASHPQVRTLGESLHVNRALAQICGMPAVPPMLAHAAAHWSDADVRKLGTYYLEGSRRDALVSAARVTDKMPGNFHYVGLIHAALPNARIIHTRRDPVDTCLSIFSILFAGDAQPYSYELGELGRYYRAYETMMAHWHGVLPAGVMIDVAYEEVVEDLERQARRIIAHCGLEWDAGCLDFHKSDRPVRTPSHAQVRQPIYRSSVGRPRPPRELLLPLLEALGVD